MKKWQVELIDGTVGYVFYLGNPKALINTMVTITTVGPGGKSRKRGTLYKVIGEVSL